MFFQVRQSTFLIAIAVACVHILTALDIIIHGDGAVVKTTPLAWLQFTPNGTVIAIILMVAGIMATIPFFSTFVSRVQFTLLLLPQQILLWLHGLSAGTAIVVGHYPDGYVPVGGSYFIFADQIWLLMIVILHTVEYVRKQEDEF